MKKKAMNRWKRFLAMVLVFSIVMTGSGLRSVTVMADNNTGSGEAAGTTPYRFTCVTTIDKVETAVPDVQLTVSDEKGNRIQPDDKGCYPLTAGASYSYKVSGSCLNGEITGKICARTLQNGEDLVNEKISVAHEQLNISMKNAECKRLDEVSLFMKGDWDLGWEWKSSDESIATVTDAGVVKGLKEGNVTISKTEKGNSGITASAEVKVVAADVKCKLDFFMEITGISRKIQLENAEYTISDDNGIIQPDSEGYYRLTEGKEYTYDITKPEGLIAGKTGKFLAPYKTEAAFEIGKIDIKVTEPVLTINGIVAESETVQLRKGSQVDVACGNPEAVPDLENWTYTVSTRNEVKKLRDKTEGLQCSDTVTITLKYNGEETRVYRLEVFEEYGKRTVYQYGKRDYEVEGITYTVKKGESEISYDEMQPWEEYDLTISGDGIVTKTVKNYSPTPFVREQTVYLETEDFIRPELSAEESLEGNYGESISLSGVKYSSCFKASDWQWKCVKKDDAGIVLPVAGGRIDLSEADPGEYVLTCFLGDIEGANSLPVKVDKLFLSIDWNKFEGASRYYDGTTEFQIKMEISDAAVVLKNSSGECIRLQNEDTLVLQGALGDSKVGSYDSLTIHTVSVENKDVGDVSKRYDCKAVPSGETEVGKQGDGKLEVRKLIVTVVQEDSDPIIVDYRTNIINFEKNTEVIKFSIMDSGNSEEGKIPIFLNKEKIQRLLYEKMQTPAGANTIYPDNTDKDSMGNVNFPGVQYDENAPKGKKYYLWDGENAASSNAIFYFENAKYEKEKGVVFRYTQTREDIRNIDRNAFELSQDLDGGKNAYHSSPLQNGDWVNMEDITGKVLGDYLETEGKEGYDAIGFIRMDEFPDSMQEVYDKLESKNSLVSEINADNQVSYYAVMFGKSKNKEIDNKWPYTTAVAILRIIPEELSEGDYPAEKENFPYPIINLYYDNIAPVVKFHGGTDEIPLERQATGIVYDTEKAESNITFDIVNKGFEISSIEYAFVEVGKGEWSIDSDNKKQLNAGDVQTPKEEELSKITSKGAGEYTVTCPEDGKYVLYVKVRTKGNQEAENMSNAFIVDSKPPVIRADFTDEEGNAYKESILKGEKTYISSKQLKAVFGIKEDNLMDCTVEVTAADFSGNPIDTGNLAEQIQAGIMESAGHTYEAILKTFGNYTITIHAVDRAENQGISELYENKADISSVPSGVVYEFTFDQEVPEATVSLKGNIATISVSDGKMKAVTEFINEIIKFVNDLKNAVREKIYGKDSVTYVLSATDRISGCKEVGYYVTDKDMSEEDLEALDEASWTPYDGTKEITVTANKQESVYQRIEDYAGNVSYAGMGGLITDTVAPEVVIRPTAGKNENDFYNGDVPLEISVRDEAPEGTEACSGLQYVTYRIEAGNEVYTPAKIPYDGRASMDNNKTSHTITGVKIDAEKFNHNEVKVYVMAADNSGNLNTDADDYKPQVFKIDTTKPEIHIAFDDGEDADYYNHTRTATVTIKERNLDVNDVDITIQSEHGSKAVISKWEHSGNAGVSDDATHTCQVTFDADDDYEFYVDCKDQADNKADTSKKYRFTIDKTIPVIDVSYSNGQVSENDYYNRAVTATIAINEHNFDAGKADIKITGQDGQTAAVSGFHDNGDTHTANVVFDRDGEYRLEVSCADEAGNEAEAYKGNTFHIDLTNPEIVIRNVKDKSANKDEVNPVITCTDENYDKDKVKITVRGANGGEISPDKLNFERKTVAEGEEFSFVFPKDEAMDDMYTLTAEMADKAGNETKESIQFSVNRYGSVYTLGTKTGEWLTDGVCSYIKEGKDVVIIETNVDEIVENHISYTYGAISPETSEVREEKECTDEERRKGECFEVKDISRGNDWYQYQYTVGAGNFTKEGNYSIQIDSKDKAGNHASNVSNKHTDSNLEILFAVDQTAPSAVISGTENGGSYREAKRTVLIDVQDNLALDTVTVYLNDKEYATYDAEEIAGLQDGFIPVEVTDSLITQTIQLEATDMAGNTLGKNVKDEYDAVFEDFNLIVTKNVFVQILHTYWIFLIIAGMAVACVIVCIIIKRKKKM